MASDKVKKAPPSSASATSTSTSTSNAQSQSLSLPELRLSRQRQSQWVAQSGVFLFFVSVLLGVAVWDIRRVAILSDVIHDDHTALWERLEREKDNSSLKLWLSPLDLCLLRGVTDASVDVQYFRVRNCSKAFQQVMMITPSGSGSSNIGSSSTALSSPHAAAPRGSSSASSSSSSSAYATPFATGSTISPLSQRLSCNIGASLGKSCPGPLSTRTYFTSRLKHPRYSDASNHHLSKSLQILAKRNMPLIFIGDGISKQNQDALICDILRTDRVTITSGTNAGSGTKNPNDFSYFTDYTIRWKHDPTLKLDVKYYKVFHISDEDENEDVASVFDFEFNFDFFGFKRDHDDRDRQRKRNKRRVLTDVPSIKPAPTPTSGALLTNAIARPRNGTERGRRNATERVSKRSREFDRFNVGIANGTDRLKRPNETNRTSLGVEKLRDPMLRPQNGTDKHKRMQQTKSSSNSTSITTRNFREKFRDSVARATNTSESNKAKLALTSPMVHRMLTIADGGLSANSSTGIVLPRYSFDKIKSVINEFIESTNRSVAIVANAGVWYNSREQFRRELPSLLSWLNGLAKDETHQHVIFYRETAAQHWNHTTNGYYDREYKEKEDNNGTCVPIEDNTPVLDWRNMEVYNAIENEGYDSIKLIPFHTITTPLYNMHPTSAKSQDCTHFCYFPQMWQPVWYEMYNATFHR